MGLLSRALQLKRDTEWLFINKINQASVSMGCEEHRPNDLASIMFRCRRQPAQSEHLEANIQIKDAGLSGRHTMVMAFSMIFPTNQSGLPAEEAPSPGHPPQERLCRPEPGGRAEGPPHVHVEPQPRPQALRLGRPHWYVRAD
jgi:hypothetical protein